MKEPKYLLVFECTKHAPFVIYEQAVINGEVGQRPFRAYTSFEEAIRHLGELNKEPVLLAYSTTPVDNKFEF